MELVISENRRTKRGKILFGRLLPVCRQRRIRPGKRTVSGAFRRPGHQMGEKPQTVLRGKRLRRLRALYRGNQPQLHLVALARLKNWEMQELSTLDVAPAVKQACEVGFDRVQMIQDDKNRWALYIKPENESGYSVYPDKEDVNRFFSTLKQAMDNIDKVRMELANKYYTLAETKPDLKVDLFSCGVKDIDLTRIQRVSVFKTKKDGILCAATIDGRRMEARAVTQQQWQRMWLAEDKDGYKRNLAASLFSDVMRQGQTQGNAVGTAASADREPEQREQEEQSTGLKR